MRFGYGLITCQRHPDDVRSDVDLYREALELAEEAEAWGFDSVWTSEHHFQDDAYMPSVLPLSAAIAARTTRIRVGVGVALAPFYDPIRLAEDAATVDLISEGRFILGLGLGWLDWEFEGFGQARRDRVTRTESLISVCRQAWGNGLLQPIGVQVTPKPAQAGGPPIWIGASAEPAVRRAGKLADGFMASEPTPTAFVEQVGWVKEERSGLESSPFAMSGCWPVFVSEDENAWEQVRPYLHYMEWKYEDSEQSRGRLGLCPMHRNSIGKPKWLCVRHRFAGRPNRSLMESVVYRKSPVTTSRSSGGSTTRAWTVTSCVSPPGFSLRK